VGSTGGARANDLNRCEARKTGKQERKANLKFNRIISTIATGRTRSGLLKLGLFGMAAALVTGSVAYGGATTTDVNASQQRSVALGIWIPGTPWNLSGLDEHEALTGKKNAIVNFFWSWDDASGPPDTSVFGRIADRGSMPMVTWMPQDYRLGTNQGAFSLSEILSGRYDSFIGQWGQALAAYGRPVMMRLAHEMNGDWYPWGVTVNGNTPDQFVAFWRHVHGIFKANGANNVLWVWGPNIDNADPALFYPGDAYVDWVGLSLYNNADWGIWRSFSEWLAPTYERVTSLTSKPLMIAEVGTGEGSRRVGGDKATWIREMYETALPLQFPRIQAVIWFNENKAGVEKGATDYSLHSSPEALQAYIDVIASPVYVTSLGGLQEAAPTPTPGPQATSTPQPQATPTPTPTPTSEESERVHPRGKQPPGWRR
jgi:hypothetical protein